MMFGLHKWQIYGLAAVAGYIIYSKYFAAPAAVANQLPAPAPVQEGTSAFPVPLQYF